MSCCQDSGSETEVSDELKLSLLINKVSIQGFRCSEVLLKEDTWQEYIQVS